MDYLKIPQTAEETLLLQEQHQALLDNQLFNQLQHQLRLAYNSKRQEQRQALLNLDKDKGLYLEGVLVGLEEVDRILKGFEQLLNKSKNNNPSKQYKY